EALRQERRSTLILYCHQCLSRKRPGPGLAPRMAYDDQACGKGLACCRQAQQPRQETRQAPLAMADRKQTCPLYLARGVMPVLHSSVEFSPGIADETRIQCHRDTVLGDLPPSRHSHTHLPMWTVSPLCGILVVCLRHTGLS